MKQLDMLWTELQPLLARLSPEEKEKITDAFDLAGKGTSSLESNYQRAIQDRGAVHSLFKKSSDDLVQRYQTLFENSGTAMVVIENDGMISLTNTLFLNLLGYRREEVENRKNFFAIFDERFQYQVQDYHRRRRDGDANIPHRHEAQVITSEGKTLDVIIMIGLFLGTSQSVVSIIDITERKRMEDELRLFKTSTERAYDEVFWLDFEGNMLYVNDAACRNTGYSREELLAMKVFKLDPGFNPAIWDGFTENLRKNKHMLFETRHQRKDGSIMDIEIATNYVTREGSEFSFAFVRDITERKQAERALLKKNNELNAAYEQLAAIEQELRTNYENLSATEIKLRESEAWSREFTELLPQFVYEIDTAGRLLFVNQYAADVFGVTHEILETGLNFRDFIVPEEWEQVQRNLTQILTGRKTTMDVYHCRRKDGSLMPANIYTAPVYRDGTLKGFRGIVVDITEALKVQEALQKSEIRFRELAELLPQIVFELDENLKFTFFNWNTIEMTGYAYDDLSQNKTGIYDILRESDRQPAEGFFARILKDSTSGHLECVMITQDGKEIPAIIYASPIINENRIAGVRGVIVDIGEQKMLESALRESETRFRELAELVPQFIFETDRNFRFTYNNLGAITVTEYSYEDFTKRLDIFSLVDIAGRHQIRESIQRILGGEDMPPIQFLLLKNDGTKLPVIMYASTIVRENEYAGIRGIIVDISDQKRLETALEITNQKLNLMNSLTRHDVLNNITGLLGLVDMLGELTPDSKAQGMISEIHNLIVTIKDQIVFTRDYQSVGVKAPQWQSLCQGINYAASMMRLDDVHLKIPESDIEIYADPFFGRVLYNLIDNSLRHGGSVRNIAIETEIAQDDSLFIRYRDDGMGVPADEKERIFEQGYGKNTGFGLFIIREILGITGMTIRETGTFRSGVLFEITVPKDVWRSCSVNKCKEHDSRGNA